jgi:ABC-type multidrug transport system ATPase subunit
MLLDEPTRGIDVEARSEIYRQIRAFTQAGGGALVVSSDLPELVGLCDRIVVVREGRVVGEVPGATATEAAVLALALGASLDEALAAEPTASDIAADTAADTAADPGPAPVKRARPRKTPVRKAP